MCCIDLDIVRQSSVFSLKILLLQYYSSIYFSADGTVKVSGKMHQFGVAHYRIANALNRYRICREQLN